jgi:integral membrane protein
MTKAATTALRNYRVMALVVGVALAVLTILILIDGLGGSAPKHFSPFHGLCYVVYLATLPSLNRRFELSKKQLVLCVLSGIIPGLAFYVERVPMRHLVERADDQ